MNAALRLAALQQYLDVIAPTDEDALPPRCRDAFHSQFDYRELAAPLYSGLTDLPPAARCPTCDGPRQSGPPLVVADAEALRWREDRWA